MHRALRATPDLPPGATCENKCKFSGYCNEGDASCCQAPSCAMGCTIGNETNSLDQCQKTCLSIPSSACSYKFGLSTCSVGSHGFPRSLGIPDQGSSPVQFSSVHGGFPTYVRRPAGFRMIPRGVPKRSRKFPEDSRGFPGPTDQVGFVTASRCKLIVWTT